MKYRIKLLSDLRQRFRKEYLSELIQKQNDNPVREPRIGEMVLIGNDNKKRLSWPIAKIIELIPGRDGEIRTVRLKTQHGTVIRPAPCNVPSLWKRVAFSIFVRGDKTARAGSARRSQNHQRSSDFKNMKKRRRSMLCRKTPLILRGGGCSMEKICPS
ncbi:DUF5641 domain-containing protein [Trichonephila clavipes]|nr:DUF5641 domain-containing protein [Trichonephila clavipes]